MNILDFLYSSAQHKRVFYSEQVNAMAPTIDAELEQIDRKHAQLARISTDLVDALSLYHSVSGIYFVFRQNEFI